MFLQDKVNIFNHIFTRFKNISNIVIWGAGVHTSKLFEKTNLLNYSINSIVDIDKKKQKSQYFGFFINSPDEINWDKIEVVIISVFGREEEVRKILVQQLNFKGEIVILYEKGESTPFYLLYDKNALDLEVQYTGNYDNWDEAYNQCEGYEDGNIINTVADAMKKVINGEAVWERDGCLFYKQKYVYPLCAAILRCAIQNNNQGVRIIDIGGSLGSTYFQNRKYLSDINKLEYIVVEQDNFVNYGRKNIENDSLKFIRNTDNWQNCGKIDIVLMSASLQYISFYKKIISKIMALRPRFIILDRILVGDKFRICKETVPENIYKSSYPVMIFSESEIVNFFCLNYELVEKDISSVPEKVYFIDDIADSKYYVFRNKNKD